MCSKCFLVINQLLFIEHITYLKYCVDTLPLRGSCISQRGKRYYPKLVNNEQTNQLSKWSLEKCEHFSELILHHEYMYFITIRVRNFERKFMLLGPSLYGLKFFLQNKVINVVTHCTDKI